jgi:glycosyltransferase involved in cell wall biosynthesis
MNDVTAPSAAPIKVSVCVVTYNQKGYVRECLDGLLAQEVDFVYEIIVGDDASTDGTAEVIREYAAKYPTLIKPMLHEKNIGAFANVKAVYAAATGMYIAHLDGDDTAFPLKLQKQVAMLDAHPECFICSHDAVVIDKDSVQIADSLVRHREGVNTLGDLYQDLPFFTHSTKMFRNQGVSETFSQFNKDTIDLEVHVAQTLKGKIYHLDECLGGYRIFVGISLTNKKVNPLIYQAVKRVFDAAFAHNPSELTTDQLTRAYANALFKFAYQSAALGNMVDAKAYIKQSMATQPFSIIQVGFWFTTYVPGLTIALVKLKRAQKYKK